MNKIRIQCLFDLKYLLGKKKNVSGQYIGKFSQYKFDTKIKAFNVVRMKVDFYFLYMYIYAESFLEKFIQFLKQKTYINQNYTKKAKSFNISPFLFSNLGSNMSFQASNKKAAQS